MFRLPFVLVATAGTTIVLMEEIYHYWVITIKNKAGEPKRWITIKAERPGTVNVTGKTHYTSPENFLSVFRLNQYRRMMDGNKLIC